MVPFVHEENKITLQEFFRMILTEHFAQLSLETLKYQEHQLFHVGDSVGVGMVMAY